MEDLLTRNYGRISGAYRRLVTDGFDHQACIPLAVFGAEGTLMCMNYVSPASKTGAVSTITENATMGSRSCNVLGMDKVFKGKFDCKGMKMEVNYGPVSTGYGVTQDPVTGEISSHTISVDVGAGKSFDVGKTVIKGKVGASAGGSITIDRTGHISDITARGSAGAGIGGPIGSSGVGLGSVEVSMSGGFNSSGPSVKSPVSSFLSGK